MEDQEEKNNEQGFFKEQRGKLTEKGKEEAKKHIKKKIMKNFVASTVISSLLYGILVTSIVLVFIFLAACIEEVDIDKSNNASKAKKVAISYGVGDSTEGEESEDNSTIKFSYDNGIYTILTNCSKDIDEIKDEIAKTGRDVSDFSDFEIGVLGALMESGLDTQKYTTDQLKCLPLFIKTEGCTMHLDLRPNSQKFDSGRNYQPQKLENLKENEIPGVILVQRTNTSEEEPKYLEYIDFNSFNNMISEKNLNVLNYFTIDKYNNLLIAKWEYIKVEVEGEYPSGVEGVTAREEYIINEDTIEKIPYNEYVRKYTMPFDFLLQLLISTNVPEFCSELTKIVADSKIVINIQEEETRNVTEDMQTYTMYTKEESSVDYDVNLSVQGQNGTFRQTGSQVLNNSENKETKTVTVKETKINHSYSFEIKEADTWLVHYIREYEKKDPIKDSLGEPQNIEELGKYGTPIVTEVVPDENDKEVKEFEENKESEFDDEQYTSVECNVTKIKSSVSTKMDIIHSITDTVERYPSDQNPTTNTDIYAKDDDGNFEKFLLIYDKFKMKSLGYWLFNRMEDNSNTVDLIDPIKYLLYMYDGKNRGVTDIDTSIFEPFDFSLIKNSKGITVKTDELLAIKTLTREELEEVIDKNFGGQAKENLLNKDVIDALMYIQDRYHVNAVFAIAVTRVKSTCGTNWGAIDPETHNWCSLQGDYKGEYYTDSSGTKWRKYGSFDEAIRDFGDWIATSSYYFRAGRYTISDIAIPYCDEIWGEDVAKYVKEMYESIGVSIYASGGNDLQQKVVEVANNSLYYGISAIKGYCQGWVANVYYRAGANEGMISACCAVHAGMQWGVSTDFSKIQVGATVYGYTDKSKVPNYGHVGIYIGDGMVAHNIGGVKIDDLDDWIKKYNGVCWGWNGGTDLTKGFYPCKPGFMTSNH